MEKKRILIVSQDMNPYTEMELGELVYDLAKNIHGDDMEVRVLMPRYGLINERRHRLHEVVRLSGINIIIDDDDYPLIIKVASLPGARMQVYFLDNEDFFKRKRTFTDKEDNMYDDNVSRMVFFCRGVLETVKKFGWAPDIIHCHGWMTSLIPVFLKTAYKKDPIFMNSKLVYSAYNNGFEGQLESDFMVKTLINRVNEEDLAPYSPTFDGLNIGAMHYADAIVQGNEELSEAVANAMEAIEDKPKMNYVEPIKPEKKGERSFVDDYKDFYTTLFEE